MRYGALGANFPELLRFFGLRSPQRSGAVIPPWRGRWRAPAAGQARLCARALPASPRSANCVALDVATMPPSCGSAPKNRIVFVVVGPEVPRVPASSRPYGGQESRYLAPASRERHSRVVRLTNDLWREFAIPKGLWPLHTRCPSPQRPLAAQVCRSHQGRRPGGVANGVFIAETGRLRPSRPGQPSSPRVRGGREPRS